MERWTFMKLAFLRQAMALLGIVLLTAALLPGAPAPTLAAPNMVVTETPTSEPPSPTFTNTATATPSITATATGTPLVPTITSTNTPGGPIDTPTATNTPGGPTDTPVIPTDEPTNPPERRTSTPTASPTNTPAPSAPPLTPTNTSIPGPDLSIDKSVSGPSEVQVGDTIEYRVVVRNNGSEPANDVVVEDRIPAFLQLISASSSRGEVTTSGPLVRVAIGTLQPGEEVVITITARILSYVPAEQSANFASASGSNTTDPPANNGDDALVVITQPTPAPPATLPRTAEPEDGWRSALFMLGVALLLASMLVRRRVQG
jgi:uncharacterized repeat protein (TIGR01451 family)